MGIPPRPKKSRVKKTSGPRSAGAHGMFTWGALGMATNFTTIPLFISSSQRIGTADLPLVVRILTLIISWWIVLIPAWLPVVIDRLRPNSSGISGRTRERISHWTSVARSSPVSAPELSSCGRPCDIIEALNLG
ncbi:hypothetical protein JCM18918_1799 [Cutibacterium acnes JCM 18918]|nr:hypothetical protein JCM18918_1799 [Cutibacterium acnes JCM 18918]